MPSADPAAPGSAILILALLLAVTAPVLLFPGGGSGPIMDIDRARLVGVPDGRPPRPKGASSYQGCTESIILVGIVLQVVAIVVLGVHLARTGPTAMGNTAAVPPPPVLDTPVSRDRRRDGRDRPAAAPRHEGALHQPRPVHTG